MKLLSFCFLFFLAACSPQSYFKSPNNVSKKKVTLYLRNEQPVTGILTIPFEENFNRPPTNVQTLKFIPEGKAGEENIDIHDITGYSLDKNYYALKNLYLLSTNSNHWLFVKRLTGEDSRIQLYELYETGRGNHTGESVYTYFISLPTYGPYETLNTHSVKLIPDFNQKMSELVSDCPSLAEKIRDRQNGYFIPLVSFNTFKHKEVMMKIVNEYNSCK